MLNKLTTDNVIKGFIDDYTKIKDDFKKVIYDNGFMWSKAWKRQNAFGTEGVWYNPVSKLSIRIRWGIRNPSAILYVEIEKGINKELMDKIVQFFSNYDVVVGINDANSDYDLLNERKVVEEIK